MKKVIRLTESDLVNIINKVIVESTGVPTKPGKPSPFNPKGEYKEGKINKKPGKPSPFNPKEAYDMEEMEEFNEDVPTWWQRHGRRFSRPKYGRNIVWGGESDND
jgi:hypothetical protein